MLDQVENLLRNTLTVVYALILIPALFYCAFWIDNEKFSRVNVITKGNIISWILLYVYIVLASTFWVNIIITLNIIWIFYAGFTEKILSLLVLSPLIHLGVLFVFHQVLYFFVSAEK